MARLVSATLDKNGLQQRPQEKSRITSERGLNVNICDAHTCTLSRLIILIATGHLFAPPASRLGVGVPFSGNHLSCMLDRQSHTNEFTIAFENYSGVLECVANCNEILRGSPPPC